MARLFANPLIRPGVNLVNAGVLAVSGSRRWGRFMGDTIAPITYAGRKTGRTRTLPVGYQRTGDTVTIRVLMPDQKSWWRNFVGAGGPLTIRLEGVDRSGHAVARRGADGAVVVTVILDQPT